MAITQGEVDSKRALRDSAKSALDTAINNYNVNVSKFSGCYNNNIYGWSEAKNGNNPYLKSSCTGFGGGMGCNGSDKNQCENFVGQVNSIYIPALKTAYDNWFQKETDYNKIFAEFNSQGPGLTSSAEAKKENAKTVAIVLAIIVGIIVVVFFANKKYKFIPSLA